MNVTPSSTSQAADVSVAFLLARLLERLDHSRETVGAAQYRSVAAHLTEAFSELSADARSTPALQALLDASPAAAEVYENLHYGEAGLCRSPLAPAVAAELQAKDIIERARRGSPHGKA